MEQATHVKEHLINCDQTENNNESIATVTFPIGTRVWLYVCSSPGNNKEIQDQLEVLKRFAQDKGWIIDKVFEEQWVSGDREAFKRMMQLSSQSPRIADLILVLDWSRFARSQIECCFYRAQLRRNGWEVLSFYDDISALSPSFQLITDFLNNQD